MPIITKKYTITYHNYVTVPPELTLRILEELIESVRELETCDLLGGARLEFELIIEGDLWEMRGTVDEIEQMFNSHGIEYIADKERIVRSVPVQ